jgi:drug/metabolite transporter (DMT)-like permease
LKKDYKVDVILLLVTMLWGINPSIIKIGLSYIDPLGYNLLRLIIASITSLTFIIVVKKYRKPDRKDIKMILLVSIGGFFVFQWFYTMGISKTTAGNTAIIMGMLPLIVLTINHMRGIKKANRVEYIGVLISFIGMVIVIIGTGKLGISYQNVLGCCFILIACTGYGIYTVFSKQLSSTYSNYQITTYAIILSTILMIILTPYNRSYHIHINPILLYSLLFSGILGVCVGNFIWIWCIGKTDSNRVAVYNNLTPVFSVLFGAALLKEKFTYIQFVGAVVILVGLYISTYRKMLKKNG